MPQVRVMFARFPCQRIDDPDTCDWLVSTVLKAKADPRISHVGRWRGMDTPIPMLRNKAIEVAREQQIDYLCMIDNDMSPDMELGTDPRAVPFWDVAFEFLWKHQGPAMIAVPYCGPPPHENVYVFKWTSLQSDHPNPDFKLEQFTREEAADRHGIERVAALPTGLCMFNMSAIARLKPPYFKYEWRDETESEKSSTEDVVFTRDLTLHGVPIYCIWDAWAGHWKRKRVGRPHLLTDRDIGERFIKVAKSNWQAGAIKIAGNSVVGENATIRSAIPPSASEIRQVIRNGDHAFEDDGFVVAKTPDFQGQTGSLTSG